MATENKNLSNYDKNTIPNMKDFRFGIVVSEWNDDVTEGLFNGAYDTLVDCGALSENILRWNVPGSFELIFGAKKMHEKKKLGGIFYYFWPTFIYFFMTGTSTVPKKI